MTPLKSPLVIGGPCMAESYDVMAASAESLVRSAEKFGFDYYFKASFDKANRSSVASYRGPGMEQAARWFEKIRTTFGCPILTDIHEVAQVSAAAAVCDVLQIPAFLCRQTDLLVAAVKSGRIVNIKKGQFMAPAAMKNIAGKVRAAAAEAGLPPRAWLTERGSMFGYGDLTVDMRSFPVMAKEGMPVIFDITHSTQKPPASESQGVSGALRCHAPVLARAALATGYVSGFFMEVHPDPSVARSDAEAQLTPKQANLLLEQLIPAWQQARSWSHIDAEFL